MVILNCVHIHECVSVYAEELQVSTFVPSDGELSSLTMFTLDLNTFGGVQT